MGQGTSKDGGKVDDLAALGRETHMDHDELKEILKAFNKLSDRHGKVSKEKFKEALKGVIDDSTFASAFFNIFDKDGSKEIDAREFVLAFAYLTNKTLEDVVETSFKCLDLNGDGYISKGEMRAVAMSNFKVKKYVDIYKREIAWSKVQITPADTATINSEADKLFALLDVNKDGQVSKEEFVSLANSNPELKKKLTQFLIKDEGVHMIAKATNQSGLASGSKKAKP